MKSLKSLENKLYWYRLTVSHVYDGDSITAHTLDHGFGMHQIVSRGTKGSAIRLSGIDAPEMGQEGSTEARNFLRQLTGCTVLARSIKDTKGKYGRYLFEIWAKGYLVGEPTQKYININELMIYKGLVTAYRNCDKCHIHVRRKPIERTP